MEQYDDHTFVASSDFVLFYMLSFK